MDVSTTTTAATTTTTTAQPPAYHKEICCDACGYPRTGLPPESLCPECGQPPPAAIVPVSDAIGAATDRSEQAWLVLVLTGLVLLIITSVYALNVALIMPIGGLTVVAVNAPAPKIYAAALLQRSIGNPGPWGVTGTLAVLGSVLGVWLITEPRSVRAMEEPTFSLRRVTRWVSVLTCGALLGALFSGYEIHAFWWGWYSLPSLAASVALVELPSNTLLYLYLARLAERFEAGNIAGGSRSRALLSLRAAAWLVCAACAVGAFVSIVRGIMQDQPVVFWRWIQSFYGAGALAAGMIMTVGTLNLTAKIAAAVVDRSVATLAGRIARLPSAVGRVASVIRSDPARWAAVAGLILWLWSARSMVGLTSMIEHRRGLGGDLPTINFIGPKVWGVPLLSAAPRRYYDEEITDRFAIVSTVLAIWLMTALRSEAICSRRQRDITRWMPTILIGMAIGLSFTIEQGTASDSHWAAALTIGIEAPATFALYLYLSKVAAACGSRKLSGQLLGISFAAAILILSPLIFYALSRPLRHFYNHPLAGIAGAIYGAIVVCAGVFAWALLVRLTWTLANTPRPSIPRK